MVFKKIDKTYHGDYVENTFDVSKAWKKVVEQKRYIEKYLAKKKSIVVRNSKNWKNIIKIKVKSGKIKKADVLYFSDNGKKYIHAAIINRVDKKKGIIKYSAHTESRYDKELDDYFKKHSKCKICIVRMKG